MARAAPRILLTPAILTSLTPSQVTRSREGGGALDLKVSLNFTLVTQSDNASCHTLMRHSSKSPQKIAAMPKFGKFLISLEKIMNTPSYVNNDNDVCFSSCLTLTPLTYRSRSIFYLWWNPRRAGSPFSLRFFHHGYILEIFRSSSYFLPLVSSNSVPYQCFWIRTWISLRLTLLHNC